MSYIEFQDINKYFGQNHVLKGIDLSIEKGELLTLLGSSGCGKSTLLRCLAGLEPVQEGKIYLDGTDITNLDARKREIGMVFQQYSLFPNMTVEQNLAFGLKRKKTDRAEIGAEVEKALDMVGLLDKRESYPTQLSGGQQQRVALARAIVMKPKVLLLDEPLSAIDAKLRKSLQIEIRRIQKELNMTTVFVTHDQDEAMVMSDRICLLNQGQIEQSGTPVEIYTAPKTRFAASFIGSYNVFTPNEYTMLTAGKEKTETSVAIRPETIAIAKEKPGRDHCLEVYGTIQESITRGNVLRYTVDVNGVKLQADTLFRSFSIFQTGERVYAAVAPAFVGQFGPKVTPGKLRAAMKQLGFADVFEVAIGADLCAVQEAEDFIKEVPEHIPFMATSCCPAWSVMAKKLFPEYADCVSMALTPMTLTARLIKKQHEKAKVVFIGPCAAKKLEAMRRSVRSEVDFVLTFEEMAGIFDARHVDIENMEEDPDGVNDASADGRNFAVAGGVAKSVVNVIKERYPDKEIKVANAEGLKECRKLLTMAKAGKYNGYLLEGMACPGGCVAGAGTMQPIKKSQAAVGLYASKAGHKTSDGTEYVKELEKLVE